MINSTNSFSDKEILNVTLGEHKLSASSITNLILESTNTQLRNDAFNILKSTLDHQKQIFDILNQKGWYQVTNANPQDIDSAKQKISSLQQTL